MIDFKINEIIYFNNFDVVKFIVLVMKLMIVIVILDVKLFMDVKLFIIIKDVKEMKGVYFWVKIGSEISWKDMLLLILMLFENCVVVSFVYYYLGGYKVFIKVMNVKVKVLGMKNMCFVELIGFLVKNVLMVCDLVVLLKVSKKYFLLGKLSVIDKKIVIFFKFWYMFDFCNMNWLVYNDNWKIDFIKIGFINVVGYCFVMCI